MIHIMLYVYELRIIVVMFGYMLLSLRDDASSGDPKKKQQGMLPVCVLFIMLNSDSTGRKT